MNTTSNPGESESHKYANGNEDILLTAEEVAKFLKISRTKAYDMIRFGDIPSVSLGRLVRVRKEDLIAFINNNVRN